MTENMRDMTKSVNVCLLEYPGAQQAAILGLRDLFDTCNRLDPAGDRFCVTITTQPISGDLLVVGPSLGVDGLPPPDQNRAEALRRVHKRGTVIASACVGAFVLAEAGLLDGRPATTHWGLCDQFAARFPDVRLLPERLLVDDGDILTAGGVMAWTDLGLRLVERFRGPARMRALARHLLLDPAPREQSYYMRFSPRLNHGDAPVLSVQHWLYRSYSEPVDVVAMARHAGLGGRTFLRRFRSATGQTPLIYLQNLRIARAQEALDSSQSPISQIAWNVGYRDVPAFSRLFQQRVGLTPGQYRRRFGGQA